MNLQEALNILGIDSSASAEEINHAYRIKAKEYHPDAEGSHDAFIKLQKAKEVALEQKEFDAFMLSSLGRLADDLGKLKNDLRNEDLRARAYYTQPEKPKKAKTSGEPIVFYLMMIIPLIACFYISSTIHDVQMRWLMYVAGIVVGGGGWIIVLRERWKYNKKYKV